MNHIYKFFLIISIGLISCEESELNTVQDARVIVEAFLHAGEPISIHISKEVLFKREEGDDNFDIEGLEITMDDGIESFLLIDQDEGIYTSDKLVSDTKAYTINFNYNGIEIQSETTIPSKPQEYTSSTSSLEIQGFTGGGPPTFSSESLNLSWSNTDESYYIVVITNLETIPSLINTSGFGGNRSFRSEPLIAGSYEIGSQNFEYYGSHAVVLYKVNAEYAALYEDPGDNSLNIKTPFTNITNGLGIFTAMNSDTLYVEITN